jgi:hypothetical protein
VTEAAEAAEALEDGTGAPQTSHFNDLDRGGTLGRAVVFRRFPG